MNSDLLITGKSIKYSRTISDLDRSIHIELTWNPFNMRVDRTALDPYGKND